MYTDFGENLKRIRKKLHLSQEQLGQKCGVSGAAISKYESGAAYPSLEIALALAQLLNVSLDTLFSTEPRNSVSVSGLTEGQAEISLQLTEQFRTQNIRKTEQFAGEQYELIGKIVSRLISHTS